MKDNRFVNVVKAIFFDVILPVLVYVFITLFVSGIIGAIGYFLSYNINIIITTAVASLLTSIALFPMYKKNAIERKYYTNKFEIKNMKYILGLGVSLCLFFNLLLIFLNIIQNDEAAKMVSESIMELNPIVAFVSVSIIVPLCEELIFRGFIFKGLEYNFNYYVAAFVSSLLFALMHGNISQGIYAFFIGFMLCYVYNRFGGLKYSYLLHLVMNFSSLFFMGFFIPDKTMIKGQIMMLILSMVLFIITMYRVIQIEKEGSQTL